MKKLLIALMIIGLSVLSTPVSAVAPQTAPFTTMAVCGDGASNYFGIQPWYACVQDENGNVVIDELNDIFRIIFPVVEALVKIAAYVAAAMIFWMLFQMITASGNSAKFATAMSGILQAIIGFVIAVVAIVIVNFIAGAIK